MNFFIMPPNMSVLKPQAGSEEKVILDPAEAPPY
jgi:hypothetical protein